MPAPSCGSTRSSRTTKFEAFASAAGLGIYNTVTDMRLGRFRRATSGPQTFALAMQSLG